MESLSWFGVLERGACGPGEALPWITYSCFHRRLPGCLPNPLQRPAGRSSWLSFRKPVSLGGLPPHPAAGAEVSSRRSCKSARAQVVLGANTERALPGMASSDPTQWGGQARGHRGGPGQVHGAGVQPGVARGSSSVLEKPGHGNREGPLRAIWCDPTERKERCYESDSHFPEKNTEASGGEESCPGPLKAAAALGSEAQHPNPWTSD